MSSKSVPSRRAVVPVWRIVGTVLALALVAGVYVVQRLLGAPALVVPADVHSSRQLEFLVIGDQGSGNGRQWRVARAMEAVAAQDRQVGFVVVLGDNFYSRGVQGTDDRQWSYKFENVYQGRYLSALPFYAVLGNHDYLGKPEAEIEYAQRRLGSGRWHMPAHAYVEDYGQVEGRPLLRMVYLDSNLTGPALAAQTRFLEQALTSTRERAPVWRAIASHHPLHNFGRYAPTVAGDGKPASAVTQPAAASAGGEGTGSEFANAVLAVVRRVPVDFVLSGHDHDLQVIAEGADPVQIVSGAAGRPPYAVERKGPALRYGASENGFVKMRLDPDVMQISVMGSDGASKAGFRWDRSCADGSAVCLKDAP
jgi:hypothetical protein